MIRGGNSPIFSLTRAAPAKKKTPRASTISWVVGLADNSCPYASTSPKSVRRSISPNEIKPVLSVEARQEISKVSQPHSAMEKLTT